MAALMRLLFANAFFISVCFAKKRHSVLMIAVDDLRTQVSLMVILNMPNCLSTPLLQMQISPYPEGGKFMHTPNMERIANRTMVFERAYVSVALCMPSRTSLLTSRRPDTSRSWTIEDDQWFRLSGGANWTTLPGAFKANGYLTLGMVRRQHL